jgi:hypothetical protein
VPADDFSARYRLLQVFPSILEIRSEAGKIREALETLRADLCPTDIGMHSSQLTIQCASLYFSLVSSASAI